METTGRCHNMLVLRGESEGSSFVRFRQASSGFVKFRQILGFVPLYYISGALRENRVNFITNGFSGRQKPPTAKPGR